MIRQISHSESQKWDDFVLSHPQSQISHLYKWRDILEKKFGLKTFYFVFESDGKILGVCPLALQKNLLFGAHLISLPFLNVTGILSSDPQVGQQLYETASTLAKECAADYLQLRHLNQDLDQVPFLDHKVTFFLNLENDPELLWKQLKDKVRNQVRKAEKEGLEFRCVDISKGIDSFYHLFSLNMHHLGTPVLPKSFFMEVASQFKEEVKLFICTFNQKPLAAGFTLIYKNKMEIPWAASDGRFLSKSPNMFLYWQILKWGCENGIKVFDFGRCSKGGGTYHFKKQWGATEVPLYWYHVPPSQSVGSALKLGSLLWKYLPLSLTQALGPKLARHLPF